MKLASFEVGPDRPLFLIAGPCVIESEMLVVEVAGPLDGPPAVASSSRSLLRCGPKWNTSMSILMALAVTLNAAAGRFRSMCTLTSYARD